jgi:hypothetical protein
MALLASLGVAAFAMGGCDNHEAGWTATREVVGAEEGDESTLHEEWRVYRETAVTNLTEMERVLHEARGEATVVDRDQADALSKRAATLRRDLAAEAALPSQETAELRTKLQGRYDGIRRDVDAFLLRLGYDREQLARWYGGD